MGAEDEGEASSEGEGEVREVTRRGEGNGEGERGREGEGEVSRRGDEGASEGEDPRHEKENRGSGHHVFL